MSMTKTVTTTVTVAVDPQIEDLVRFVWYLSVELGDTPPHTVTRDGLILMAEKFMAAKFDAVEEK